MALIDEVKAVCDDLAPHGWRDLLLAHGLDIGVAANKLAAALAAPLDVDRNVPGFDDFIVGANKARGIEPGKPAFSLLITPSPLRTCWPIRPGGNSGSRRLVWSY
jgi:hypothetical protein